MIYFMNVIDLPINIGNRPPHSPPAYIPITFELAVLLAGGSSFFGFFTLARLPRPYHPVFESENFSRAVDRRLLPFDRAAARRGRQQGDGRREGGRRHRRRGGHGV